MQTQRDAFWDQIYRQAKEDRDLIVISADMGAPSLDQFRRDFPHQFINTGIAEQNAILVASGLAKEGKNVFVYAIASFLTLNCVEKIRVQNCMMEIPINIVGVGAGFSYPDSGPTHHLIEDLSVMRALPKMNIYSITDRTMAEQFACDYKLLKGTNYIRLERQARADIYSSPINWNDGFSLLKESGETLIISTGIMTHNACALAKENPEFAILDLYKFPVDQKKFASALSNYRRIVTLEEHVLAGGLGSYVLELMADARILKPVQRIGIDGRKGYCYRYGGREALWHACGIDQTQVLTQILENA